MEEVERGRIRNKYGTAVMLGNPNPDPIAHQEGIDRFARWLYETVEKNKRLKELEDGVYGTDDSSGV